MIFAALNQRILQSRETETEASFCFYNLMRVSAIKHEFITSWCLHALDLNQQFIKMREALSGNSKYLLLFQFVTCFLLIFYTLSCVSPLVLRVHV